MSAFPQPAQGPAHQCLNMACGCNDQVSAGPCSEWCAAYTTELADVVRGKDDVDKACGCGHLTCAANPGLRGTPERGLA